MNTRFRSKRGMDIQKSKGIVSPLSILCLINSRAISTPCDLERKRFEFVCSSSHLIKSLSTVTCKEPFVLFFLAIMIHSHNIDITIKVDNI